MPHGESQQKIDQYAASGPQNCGSLRRLPPARSGLISRYYGEAHNAPQWLGKFVYGLPELHREEMKTASYISGVGCNATAANLALFPLVKAGLLDPAKPVIVEIKVGSSEGGARSTPARTIPSAAGSSAPFPLTATATPPR